MVVATWPNEYYNWIVNIAFPGDLSKNYTALLDFLYRTEYKCGKRSKNHNRLCDGIYLRDEFETEYLKNEKNKRLPDSIKSFFSFIENPIKKDAPCSMLEMMVALCKRCESIMSDDKYGDRTHQWFWIMLVSLGLGKMSNDRFDEKEAVEIIKTFLSNQYNPDGRGGLFTIREFSGDMREMDIWTQMCWFLNTIS